jgi:hypothetical protein
MGRMAATICIVCLMTASAAGALENTEANRLKEANRYLKATPPEEMVLDMAENMAKNMPEEKRGDFIEVMTKQLDLVSLRKTMLDAMVKHFTADELGALADFYGSPLGKSAMKKFGPYMGDVMPKLQADIMKAVSQFMQPGQ